jgi:hypothetical protein
VNEDEKVRLRIAGLLETGLIGDAAPLEGARVLKPIPVADPASGNLHSWFVPVAVDKTLAGFAEVRPDLELVRYSSFQRRPGEAADLTDWTDPETIRRHAARASRPDETLGEPILTYDREPSRVAWAVTATDRTGRSRTLYVAGDYVYERPAEPHVPEIGGRPST